MSGILYGTGVGPGESGLLTLKAVRIIQASDLIVVPVSAEDFRRRVYPSETVQGVSDCAGRSAEDPGKTGAWTSDADEKRKRSAKEDP